MSLAESISRFWKILSKIFRRIPSRILVDCISKFWQAQKSFWKCSKSSLGFVQNPARDANKIMLRIVAKFCSQIVTNQAVTEACPEFSWNSSQNSSCRIHLTCLVEITSGFSYIRLRSLAESISRFSSKLPCDSRIIRLCIFFAESVWGFLQNSSKILLQNLHLDSCKI